MAGDDPLTEPTRFVAYWERSLDICFMTGTHAIKAPWTARAGCLHTATLGRINFPSKSLRTMFCSSHRCRRASIRSSRLITASSRESPSPKTTLSSCMFRTPRRPHRACSKRHCHEKPAGVAGAIWKGSYSIWSGKRCEFNLLDALSSLMCPNPLLT